MFRLDGNRYCASFQQGEKAYENTLLNEPSSTCNSLSCAELDRGKPGISIVISDEELSLVCSGDRGKGATSYPGLTLGIYRILHSRRSS